MNFEKLLNLVLSNPTNICIEYSNIDGVEQLKVNGEEVREDEQLETEDFDDTDIKELISEYKNNIETLDDDIFVEAMEEIENEVNLTDVDKLLAQEHFTEEEAEIVDETIGFMNSVIYDIIDTRINELQSIKQKFY